MKRFFVALALLFLGVSNGFCGENSKPNILIILTDDLGYGDLSYYNAESKIPTKHLDRLAKEGMRFTDAHSPSAVCSPTRYGLLTGRYAFRTRLQKGVIGPWGAPLIEAHRLTLPALLKRLGYRTACIGKWHLGWNWPTKDGKVASSQDDKLSNVDFRKPIADGPTTRGFDYYFGTDVPNFPPFCFIENNRTVGIPSAASRAEFNVPGPMLPDWQWSEVLPGLAKHAVKYIEDSTQVDAPFFLYLALTSPHFPVVPAPEFKGTSKAGDYGDFVVQTDAVVGEVLAALERAKAAKNTLVIFTSDNGPEVATEIGIGVYERLRRFGHASMGRLRGVKRDVWEGGHRVPFIVRWPGKVSPDSVSDQLLVHTDLLATLAAILDVKVPASVGEDSVNMLPALKGNRFERPPAILAGSNGKLAIRQGDWVLIAGASGQENTAKIGEPDWFRQLRKYTPHQQPMELFNLRSDLEQRNNLFATENERAVRMRATLDQIRKGTK